MFCLSQERTSCITVASCAFKARAVMEKLCFDSSYFLFSFLNLAYSLIEIVLNVETTSSCFSANTRVHNVSRGLFLTISALGKRPSRPCASSDSTLGQHQRWSSRPRLWSSQRSCLGLVQQSYYSTQEAEKEPEEEPLHNIITDTESVEGEADKISHVLLD